MSPPTEPYSPSEPDPPPPPGDGGGKLSVALLTREFPPEVYGGAGVHVEHLAAELDRLTPVGVHCFGAPRQSRLVARTYQPWTAIAGNDGPARSLQVMSVNLAMAAGVQGADVVHSHTWYTNLGGHLAKLLHRIPHVMTAHSLEPLRPWKADQLGAGYTLSQYCERTGIEGADGIIAVSEAMAADVRRAYPSVDAKRIHIIHNGVDPRVYQPDPAIDVVERCGLDPTRPIVVFVGRITEQKGIFHLLDAAPHLDRSAQVVLCAAGADNEAIAREMRDRVERLQRHRGGVVWIDQPLERRDVIQLLSHARVFVCPSVYEPFGLVNVEAMACEAPVVATAVGGIPEIVVDGETGYLVPFEPVPGGYTPADPARLARDLADRIDALVEDPQRARHFGRAGRQRVIDHFAWPAVAAKTVALYQMLVAER